MRYYKTSFRQKNPSKAISFDNSKTTREIFKKTTFYSNCPVYAPKLQ